MIPHIFLMDEGVISDEATRFSEYYYQFDGVDEYLSIPNDTAFEFAKADSFSISFWIKPDSATLDGVFAHYSGGVGYMCNITGSGSDTNLRFWCRVDSSNELKVITQGTPIALSEWSFITITYGGSASPSSVKIYVNGVSQTLTTEKDTLTTGDFYETTAALDIGRRLGEYFEGALDEFSLHNIELSAAQVSEIYNSGLILDLSELTTYTNCVAWWRLGDLDSFSTNFTVVDSKAAINGASVNMESEDKISY